MGLMAFGQIRRCLKGRAEKRKRLPPHVHAADNGFASSALRATIATLAWFSITEHV